MNEMLSKLLRFGTTWNLLIFGEYVIVEINSFILTLDMTESDLLAFVLWTNEVMLKTLFYYHNNN